MDMLKCPWGPAKKYGIPQSRCTNGKLNIHHPEPTGGLVLSPKLPGQDAFPPARLCSCGTEELLLVSLGVSATWLRCKVSRMGMDVLTTHWYFMGAMGPAISSPISHSGHSAKPQSVTCPRCSQRPPWLWSRWTRATARFGPWDNDNMDITLHPINIPSTVSIFWISGYCIKISHVTNWLFPTSRADDHWGTTLLSTFCPPGMLPPTAGDQARWEAAKDGFWIGKNKIIISDFLKKFAAAREVSDRKHRCDVNPTGPHQCQSLLLLLLWCRGMQSGLHFLSQPPPPPPQHLSHITVFDVPPVGLHETSPFWEIESTIQRMKRDVLKPQQQKLFEVLVGKC